MTSRDPVPCEYCQSPISQPFPSRVVLCKNPDCVKQRRRKANRTYRSKWYARMKDDPEAWEAYKAYYREYMKEHGEKYYNTSMSDPEKHKLYRERKNAYMKKYRKAKPEKFVLYQERRNAKKKAAKEATDNV